MQSKRLTTYRPRQYWHLEGACLVPFPALQVDALKVGKGERTLWCSRDHCHRQRRCEERTAAWRCYLTPAGGSAQKCWGMGHRSTFVPHPRIMNKRFIFNKRARESERAKERGEQRLREENEGGCSFFVETDVLLSREPIQQVAGRRSPVRRPPVSRRRSPGGFRKYMRG